MDNQRTLSEIAKALMVEHPEKDPKSLREKAGLLALLNLLGIMDAFFGEGLKVDDLVPPQTREEPTPERSLEPSKAYLPEASSEIAETTSVSKATLELSRPPGEDSSGAPASLFGSLAKILGASSGGDGGSYQGLDPAIIAPMLSLASMLPKLMKPKASGTEGDGESSEAANPADAGLNAPAEKPSPLQQVLGFDPKILTLILNLIAGLDILKPKQAEYRQSGLKEPEPESPQSNCVSEPGTDPLQLPGKEPSLATHRKESPLGSSPRGKPRSRLHKPGLGIYRNWPGRPEPTPQ